MSPWWIKPAEAEPGISPRTVLASSIVFTLAIVLNLLIAVWNFSKGAVWPGAAHLAVAVGLLLVAGVVIVEMRKRRPTKPPLN